MICMEMKNNKMSALKTVNKLLDGLYKKVQFEDCDAYVNKKGIFFRLYAFPGSKALCVEYEDDKTYASKGLFASDGDRFYLDDYETIDEMLKDITKEIDK